jgi:hypothetical protein
MDEDSLFHGAPSIAVTTRRARETFYPAPLSGCDLKCRSTS